MKRGIARFSATVIGITLLSMVALSATVWAKALDGFRDRKSVV